MVWWRSGEGGAGDGEGERSDRGIQRGAGARPYRPTQAAAKDLARGGLASERPSPDRQHARERGGVSSARWGTTPGGLGRHCSTGPGKCTALLLFFFYSFSVSFNLCSN